MPSPFPGMDPYLEDPAIWPDFHDRFATEISNVLNGDLPAPYYARLEMRSEVGIVEEDARRRIVPDVAVVRHAGPRLAEGGVAVLERGIAESPSFELAVPAEPIRHHFVEIRDPTRGHELVTLIEILSPSNKHPGPDQRTYRKKQAEILDSATTNLVELDLLRTGERVRPRPELEMWLDDLEPPAAYAVWINRSWTRDRYQVFPIGLRDPLPRIPIPLREGEVEPLLDLQDTFRRIYDRGPYRRGAVDYSRPPTPPLSEADAAWAAALLSEARPDP
jgi:hypothetical protein